MEKNVDGRHFAMLKAVFDASPDMITVSSLDDGSFLEVNDAFEEQSGYTRGEVLGASSLSLGVWIEPGDRLRFRTSLEANQVVRGFEANMRTKSGTVRRYQLSASVLRTEGLSAVVTMFRDITDASAATGRATKMAFLLERAEEMAKIGSWEFDYLTKIVEGSEGAARIYGVPRENLNVATIEGVPLPEYRPLLDRARDAHVKEGEPYDVEFKIRRQDDGAILDIHSKAKWDGANKRLFGIIRDVTEEKRAEAGLKEAIATRDALIHELYHRINNTLQTILSLLALEETREGSAAVVALTERMTKRVTAIAQVHDCLYETRNLSRIDLGAFLSRLQWILGTDAPRREYMELVIDSGGVGLSIDTAVSCGIILAELVDNAVRHAYPAGSGGPVRVAARRLDDGKVELSVADDGCGIRFDPDDPPAGCLGLRLVRILAESQLRGSVKFSGPPGFICGVSFYDGFSPGRL